MVVEARIWHIVKRGDGGAVCLQECYAYGPKRTVDIADQCLGEQCGEKANHPDHKGLLFKNTALLLVCRQFYEDAVDVVELKWQDHVFLINLQPRDTLMAFVEKLTQRRRKAIKTLHVRFPEWNSGDCYPVAQENPLYMVPELIGLRCLTINLRGEIRQMSQIDLRGATGLQLMPLRSLDLDLASIHILASTIPPAGIPHLMRIRPVDIDYSGLWRKSIALPSRGSDGASQPL